MGNEVASYCCTNREDSLINGKTLWTLEGFELLPDGARCMECLSDVHRLDTNEALQEMMSTAGRIDVYTKFCGRLLTFGVGPPPVPEEVLAEFAPAFGRNSIDLYLTDARCSGGEVPRWWIFVDRLQNTTFEPRNAFKPAEPKSMVRLLAGGSADTLLKVSEKPPGGLRRGASSASVGFDTTRATSSAAVTAVSAQTAGSGMPPVCQSLIMPQSELHFNMNFHELINISKGVALDIKSSSGKSTVRCRLLDAAAGAKRVELELHSLRRSKDPALIVTVVQRAPNADVLEVLNCRFAPYGSIATVSGSQAKLIINEVEGMIFQVNDLQIFELVAMRGGVQVGRALRALKGGFSVWNISIAPGADWPMIVAAFVSMLALDFPAGSGLAAALSRGA